MSQALISRFFSLRLKFRMGRYMVAKFSWSPYMAWIWLPRFIYGGQPGNNKLNYNYPQAKIITFLIQLEFIWNLNATVTHVRTQSVPAAADVCKSCGQRSSQPILTIIYSNILQTHSVPIIFTPLKSKTAITVEIQNRSATNYRWLKS